MWSHVPLCHTERSDWQSARRGGEHAKSPGSLCRGTGLGPAPLWASALWTSLPLLLCHEIAPQGTPRLPMAVSMLLGHAGSSLSWAGVVLDPPCLPWAVHRALSPGRTEPVKAHRTIPGATPWLGQQMAAGYLWCVLARRLPKPVSHSCLPMLLVKLLLEQLTPQISPIWSLGATVLQLRRCASPWAVSHHQLHHNQLKKMLPAQKVK